MVYRFSVFILLLVCLVSSRAETIHLRDKAAVTGRILTEKRDQVIVDLGFTVLSIPRNAISRIAEEDAPASVKTRSRGKSEPAAKAVSPGNASDIFTSGNGNMSDKSVRELVNELGEAVVQVRTPGGLGSGFFLTDDGYLITNFHVIEGETQIALEVYHQRNGQLERTTYRKVRIVAMNKFTDLALLKIEDKDAPKFKKVPLADEDALSVGDSVFAIGSPLGLERTVTEGIVSTKTRQMFGQLYLQTTAQINPGNSGGPLFNMRGEVVGVTNMKIFGEGIGFAIPVDAVRYFLRHRDAYAYDNDNPSNPFRYLEPPSSRIKQPHDSAQTVDGE